MRIAFVFPGQGAQYPGMGKDLFEASDKVKELFDIAQKTSGIDVQKLLFEGTADELKASDKAQVAITLVNLAAAQVLKENGYEASAVAGFSLGEYAALVESGVLTAEEAFSIVKVRGELMEKASRELDSPEGNPGMAAVIGLGGEAVVEAVEKAGIDGLYVANYNSPVQTVISGTAAGITAAQTVLKEAGARRVLPLQVSGPFHSPLLEKAKQEFEKFLEPYDFRNPEKNLYSNVTGKQITSGEDAKRLAVEQVVSSVRWVEEEKQLVADGFDTLIEAGPGKVLTGLWSALNKELNTEIPCFEAGTLEQIQNIKG